VTFLDAYALVALVGDEAAAEEVEAILRQGEARVVVVNLAEAVDISQRVHHLSARDVRAALEPLLLGRVLSAAVSDEVQAWLAAELRIKHFDKKTRALSMADCFLLAHALADGGPIATADPPLAEVARAEGVAVVALPDSSGTRP
jgi:PIN domain nuclease of toxin-antitoxin system